MRQIVEVDVRELESIVQALHQTHHEPTINPTWRLCPSPFCIRIARMIDQPRRTIHDVRYVGETNEERCIKRCRK